MFIKQLFLITCFLFTQQWSNKKTADECLTSLLENSSEQTSGTLLTQAALFFIGKPYVGGTLDECEEEQLVVNLQTFDCATLVDNCLALSLCAQQELPQFDGYQKLLQKIRYRNGEISGYTSRLHYSSDWILENEKAGFIRNITKELGGKKHHLRINYMSSHPERYKHLKKSPCNVQKIKKIEQEINRTDHYYIPKEEILACSQEIRDGDIIFFVTSIAGLDFSHMGIAYWHQGELSFIHASSRVKQVIINPQPMHVYCQQQKQNLGIVVCRPQLYEEHSEQVSYK